MADSLSNKPWHGGAENYDTATDYCNACLVDLNDGSGPKTKSACHLPVKEPSGAYNRAALGAAAAALAGGRGGGVQIPPAAKKLPPGSWRASIVASSSTCRIHSPGWRCRSITDTPRNPATALLTPV